MLPQAVHTRRPPAAHPKLQELVPVVEPVRLMKRVRLAELERPGEPVRLPEPVRGVESARVEQVLGLWCRRLRPGVQLGRRGPRLVRRARSRRVRRAVLRLVVVRLLVFRLRGAVDARALGAMRLNLRRAIRLLRVQAQLLLRQVLEHRRLLRLRRLPVEILAGPLGWWIFGDCGLRFWRP